MTFQGIRLTKNLIPPHGQLTRARDTQQVLALRLVGIDGRYLDIVFRVCVQVFQLVGGLVVVQDGLRAEEPERQHAVAITGKCLWRRSSPPHLVRGLPFQTSGRVGIWGLGHKPAGPAEDSGILISGNCCSLSCECEESSSMLNRGRISLNKPWLSEWNPAGLSGSL